MKRGAYRGDHQAELEKLEGRRKTIGAQREELAVKAEMSLRTLQRIFATNKAFPRQVVALKAAMAELERAARREARDGE